MKAAVRTPLAEIAFCKFLIKRPTKQNRERLHDHHEDVPDSKDAKRLHNKLTSAAPDLLCLRYGGAHPAKPEKQRRLAFPHCDGQHLWSQGVREFVQQHIGPLPRMSDEERINVTKPTIVQANKPRWYKERLGKITHRNSLL